VAAATEDRPLYEVIRDQIIDDIGPSRPYPAGALLPSVREIMARWNVSTTTARRVLAELVSLGYARSQGPRGHISTGTGITPGMRPVPRPGIGSAAERDRTVAPVQPSKAIEARLERISALADELTQLVAEIKRDYGLTK
jgi:DNA-binding transcriptional regulator YhcF (GntR family)